MLAQSQPVWSIRFKNKLSHSSLRTLLHKTLLTSNVTTSLWFISLVKMTEAPNFTTAGNTTTPVSGGRGGGGGFGVPSEESVIAACFFYTIIALVAVFGNLMVVTAFFINDKLRTVTNYFVIGLAAADILVGAVSVPLWMYILIYYAERKPIDDSFMDLNTLYTTLDSFAGISSILHLMAISMERYFCVGWAVKHRNTKKYVYYIALFLVWFISALAASVKLMIPHIKPEDHVLLTFVVFFLLPLTIIVVSYAAIWKIAMTRMNNNPSKRSLKREIRTATTIAFVIGFFLIAWTPFFITLVVTVYCSPVKCPFNWSAVIFYKFLHYSNSSINPIVYGVRIPEFRKTFKFILRRICGPVIAPCRN